jgi:hypothetical protein
MALTAFTSRLGAGQGRVRTPQAISGDYALVLGDVEAGRLFDLAPGDHAEVSQTVDVTGMAFVRASLRLRVPASTPSGLGWEASILVDSAKLARARAKPGRERLVTDLAGNVSKLSGTHTVAVRLELVSV